jgi:hypothetical protein
MQYILGIPVLGEIDKGGGVEWFGDLKQAFCPLRKRGVDSALTACRLRKKSSFATIRITAGRGEYVMKATCPASPIRRVIKPPTRGGDAERRIGLDG